MGRDKCNYKLRVYGLKHEKEAARLFFNTKKERKKQNEETHLYPRGNAHAVPLHHSLRRRPRNSDITALDYQTGKVVSKTYVNNELFLLKVDLGIPRFFDLPIWSL